MAHRSGQKCSSICEEEFQCGPEEIARDLVGTLTAGLYNNLFACTETACCYGWFGAGFGWLFAGVADCGGGGLFPGVLSNL